MGLIFVLAAVLSSAFMAAVLINDRIFLSAGDEPILSDANQMLVVSSFIPLGALVWTLIAGFEVVPFLYIVGAFLAGTLWTISNAAFFAATKLTHDFDEVSAWDASPALFVALLGLPFGMRLKAHQWLGIVVVTTTLLAFRYALKGRAKVTNKRQYYGCLVLHVGTLSGTMFGFDYLLTQLGQQYYEGLYIPYLAGQSVGFVSLVSRNLRQQFRADMPKIRRFWPALAIGEVCFVISLSLLTWAMKGFPGPIVLTLGASYPLMIFMVGPIIRRLEFFQRFGDMRAAFPPQPGQGWKKGAILVFHVLGQGILRPTAK